MADQSGCISSARIAAWARARKTAVVASAFRRNSARSRGGRFQSTPR